MGTYLEFPFIPIFDNEYYFNLIKKIWEQSNYFDMYWFSDIVCHMYTRKHKHIIRNICIKKKNEINKFLYDDILINIFDFTVPEIIRFKTCMCCICLCAHIYKYLFWKNIMLVCKRWNMIIKSYIIKNSFKRLTYKREIIQGSLELPGKKFIPQIVINNLHMIAYFR
jgi:hypothetical protein